MRDDWMVRVGRRPAYLPDIALEILARKRRLDREHNSFHMTIKRAGSEWVIWVYRTDHNGIDTEVSCDRLPILAELSEQIAA